MVAVPKPPASTWAPIPLGPIIAALKGGDVPGLKPSILTRSDGPALLYPAAVNFAIGEPETGKFWFAGEAARQQIAAALPVVYLDFEDSPYRIVDRMLRLGVPPAQLIKLFFYHHPDEPMRPDGHSLIDRLCAKPPPLVVIDGVTEAMTLEGLKLNDNNDVASWYRRLPRRMADAGSCVLLLDHVTKAQESRGRYPVGGQHKLAATRGSGFELTKKVSYHEGRNGMVQIDVVKDSPGQVRREAVGTKFIAEMHVLSVKGGGVKVELRPPPSHFQPTTLMQRVSEYLEEQDPDLPASQRELERAVTGKMAGIRQAVDELVKGGYVDLAAGPHGAKLYVSKKAYRAPVEPVPVESGPDEEGRQGELEADSDDTMEDGQPVPW